MAGNWMRQAECLDADPEVFFPSKVGNPRYDIPRTICVLCPVKDECLEFELALMLADSEYTTHGMFGGTTPPERQRILAGREARKRGALVAVA